METEIESLKARIGALRLELEVLTDLERFGRPDPKARQRAAAKLAHVERRLFLLRQRRLF